MMTKSLVADSAERLFSGKMNRQFLEQLENGIWPSSLWEQVARNGYPDALVPETKGGFGGNWSDVYEILRSAGANSLPLPLAETIVAKYLLGVAGLEIPNGPVTVIEQSRRGRLRISLSKGILRLHGIAPGVPWARWCNWAAVSAMLEGAPVLALLDLKGQNSIVLTERNNIAGEPRDELSFQDTACATYARFSPPCRQPVWVLGALTRCISSVGALESALELSLTYAREREQFGRPIGRYQAIQHLLAVLTGEVSSARMATQVAAAAMPGPTAGFDVAVAKVRSGEAAGRGAAIAHQVHGAMGTTLEYGLNFLTRRLWSWRREFGTDAHWAEQLGAAAIAGGAPQFWQGLTARSLL